LGVPGPYACNESLLRDRNGKNSSIGRHQEHHQTLSTNERKGAKKGQKEKHRRNNVAFDKGYDTGVTMLSYLQQKLTKWERKGEKKKTLQNKDDIRRTCSCRRMPQYR